MEYIDLFPSLLPAEKVGKPSISPLTSEHHSLLEKSESPKKLNVTSTIAHLAVKLDFSSVVCLEIHGWRTIGAELRQKRKEKGETHCKGL